MIVDCYALNVDARGAVWCCYYSEFPLVRIQRGRAECMGISPVRGSHHFAVQPPWVVFVGHYDDDQELVVAEMCGGQQIEVRRRFRLVNDLDDPMQWDHVAARGDNLCFVVGGEIVWLTVADCVVGL